MGASYSHDFAAFGEHVLRGDLMRGGMLARADAVKARAEETAPVDQGGPHPGRYKDAFKASAPLRTVGTDSRIVGHVENNSPEALFVEFGTETNDPRHVLARALDAVAYSDGHFVAIRRFGIGGQSL